MLISCIAFIFTPLLLSSVTSILIHFFHSNNHLLQHCLKKFSDSSALLFLVFLLPITLFLGALLLLQILCESASK